jgi:hypothetical protein
MTFCGWGIDWQRVELQGRLVSPTEEKKETEKKEEKNQPNPSLVYYERFCRNSLGCCGDATGVGMGADNTAHKLSQHAGTQ